MSHALLPGLSVEQGVPNLSSFNHPYTIAFTIVSLLLYIFFRGALPKPISDIPYNESSKRNILGDIPSLTEGVRRTGEYNLWLLEQASRFRAPLFQVFIRPLSKPILIMCDFRESQDILMRRKDFDRSSLDGDFLEGVGPNHHLTMKTNSEWKRHRRLLQDLMSPGFLNEVAGPTVYNGVLKLIDLWNDKARLADGRPFSAETDIYSAALDAVMVFTFGGSFSSSATGPLIDAVKTLKAEDIKRMQGGGVDDPMVFPKGDCDEKIKATLDVPAALEHVQGSPVPRWKWWLVEKRPEVRKAISTKKAYVEDEIGKALRRLENGHEGEKALSAVELMVRREKKLAENEGRQPDYFSPVMNDEVFGVVVAGHDTTSTTMSWGVKFLADGPRIQTKLREALRAGFANATAEGRSPTIKEITSTKIHYLDATMEEILRCGGATPFVTREATCDTELLGHFVPKGTNVMCLTRGPSMLQPAFEVDDSRRSKSSRAAKARAWDNEDIGDFKPERWLVAGEFDQQAGPALAFGLGTRGCFGRKLAYLELRILVALIVWNFELLPCPEELSGYAAKEGLTYRPKDCYVRLRRLGKTQV